MNTENENFTLLATDPQLVELHTELQEVTAKLVSIIVAAVNRSKEILPSLKDVHPVQVLDPMLMGLSSAIFADSIEILDPEYAEQLHSEIDDAILSMTPTSGTVH
jgi:hypothetical protein